MLSFERFSYIQDIRPLPDMRHEHPFNKSLANQKFHIFMRSSLSMFPLMGDAISVKSKTSLPTPRSQIFSVYFLEI